MICRSFAPVYVKQAKVMIVGSMPSVQSLADAQYYAHPRNAFWPIMFDVFGVDRTGDYEKRKALIRDHGLALWDVAGVCEREGSLDSNMRNIQFNDFAALYEACPEIHTVLCNGATAYSLFMKSGFAGDRRVFRLPSTSPAYTMTYAGKLDAWKRALEEALK
ncbi:MAG: DNA-deoxyinosine glycosylase [Clostridia bacterium]|nr:DNA-deoxyinosine glycosylase [Clostridia bacterium]